MLKIANAFPARQPRPLWLELPVPRPKDPEKPKEPEDEPVLPPDRKPRPVKDPPRRRDVPEPPEIEEPGPPKPKRRALNTGLEQPSLSPQLTPEILLGSWKGAAER
ncbi:MAG TPA: hypothetical protein VFG52_07230 [Xanthomonadales bacterium]|nr:hypothetical protein [Xanthomonadales bacterium]